LVQQEIWGRQDRPEVRAQADRQDLWVQLARKGIAGMLALLAPQVQLG
jgi:hypothetical protein